MILAGDIGGTKINLAGFEVAAGRLKAKVSDTFPSRDYSRLEDVVRLFLAGHRLKVEHACFGIPGPVKQGRSLLTNLGWTIDAQEVARGLGLGQVWLLNDLQANAYGVAALSPEDFVSLNDGNPDADGNQAIIAAGTGLGEGGMVRNGGRQIAIASEGGHADFAPRTDLDMELFHYLRAQFGQVVWEHVLSGPGQFNIYKFLRDTKRGEEPAWLAAELRRDEPPPAVITRAALAGKCRLCEQALDMFVTYYGAEAANLALKFMAAGGVFVGGGIAPKIIGKLKDGTFLKAFIGAGRMKSFLETVPVRVILNEKTALLGAARFAAMQTGQIS